MSNFETQPLEDWFRSTPNGDVALCDPFNGEPLCGPHVSMEPKTPTEAFVSDFQLGNGYGYWRGRKIDENPPYVAVYLVDPSRPGGLGPHREFRELAEHFDVVAYDTTQAVRMEDIRRRAPGGVGKIALAGGVESNATFLSALLDSHHTVVDLAPPIDMMTGKPANDAARGLQAVRDAVVGQEIDQKDPNDPDLRYLATDYVYANTSQWHTVMASGNLAERMGRLTAMLVVLPHEQADFMRKLVVSGLPQERIDFRFARKGYDIDHNVNTGSYAFALDRGYIPYQQLRDADLKR